MRAKAQRQTDTDTSREKTSRVVDRTPSAINVFHLETQRCLPQFCKRQLDLDRPWECMVLQEVCQSQDRREFDRV